MMDTLEQAANAAGFAMAAPDDDFDDSAAVRSIESTGRGLVLAQPSLSFRRPPVDALSVASDWFRAYLPLSLGGRATA